MGANKPRFFEEGKVYDFLITNTTSLPPDDEPYLILLSMFHTKHLLPSRYYMHYDFKTGQNIQCRVDKINCSGRMFHEPVNPYYKAGEVYEFNINGRRKITNSRGLEEEMLILEDKWKQEIPINTTVLNSTCKQTVTCRVDRVKKGRLYLSLPGQNPDVSAFEINKMYLLKVKDIFTMTYDEEYFRLEDERGRLHYLREKYYKNYGFDVGDIINCCYLGYTPGYNHYFEPQHPLYKIGNVYEFRISGIDTFINEFGKEVSKVKVYNDSQKEFFVDCSAIPDVKNGIGQSIRCRVNDIRMSRLKLECLG
jgi:hypothetical protein